MLNHQLTSLKGERDLVALTIFCIGCVIALVRRFRVSTHRALAAAIALFVVLKRVALFPSGSVQRSGAPGSIAPLAVGRTHYQLEGPANGPLVVLVHGFCGELTHMAPLAASLVARGIQVIHSPDRARITIRAYTHMCI